MKLRLILSLLTVALFASGAGGSGQCPAGHKFCQDSGGWFEFNCCNNQTETCAPDADPLAGPLCLPKDCGPGFYKCMNSDSSGLFLCCEASEPCDSEDNGRAWCGDKCPAGQYACNAPNTSLKGVCCKLGNNCDVDGEEGPKCKPTPTPTRTPTPTPTRTPTPSPTSTPRPSPTSTSFR